MFKRFAVIAFFAFATLMFGFCAWVNALYFPSLGYKMDVQGVVILATLTILMPICGWAMLTSKKLASVAIHN